MNKKIIIEIKPNNPIWPSDIAQGNKNAISKSNIINKIATRKNLTSNSFSSEYSSVRKKQFQLSFTMSNFFHSFLNRFATECVHGM